MNGRFKKAGEIMEDAVSKNRMVDQSVLSQSLLISKELRNDPRSRMYRFRPEIPYSQRVVIVPHYEIQQSSK